MQAPLRLTLTFLLAVYSFFFSASSPFFYADDHANLTGSASSLTGSAASRLGHPKVYAQAGGNIGGGGYVASGWGGDALKNRVFFTFMFVETMSWFWVWVTLQEERREMLARKARRRSGSYMRDQ